MMQKSTLFSESDSEPIRTWELRKKEAKQSQNSSIPYFSRHFFFSPIFRMHTADLQAVDLNSPKKSCTKI